MTIAPTAIIHPNVILGNDVVIEDYCIIGTHFQTVNKVNIREYSTIGNHVSIEDACYD
jgi:acyl-[acyl carrier protein]--UDP-N-acetylglucosamine O-acyltransferase